MTIAELFSRLRERNIKVAADNGQLVVNGPRGSLTPELRAELAAQKEAILGFLGNPATSLRPDEPPLRPASRERSLPLSFSQQRLWFLDQYEPNSSVYNIPSALRLRGSLNIEALEQSLNEILRRHESLRTTFSMVDGEAVQVIAPAVGFSLAVVDLSDHPEGEREEEARQLASEEAGRPFDLAQGPLFRSKLLRLGEDDQVLLLTMHHIVLDGWSTGVLYHELSVLYRAFLNGQPSPLPELPIQYADFAVWQRDWLQGEVLERQLSYWKKQLEGIPAVLNFPTDRPRPAVQSFQGERHSIELSRELTEGLKALSRKEGVTLFMTLLAAFQTLLYRYTGQEDIVVGSPIANRNRREIEDLIGFFVNTLVLRSGFSGNPTFKELLARVRQSTLEAYDHQDLPFEKLVEELQPERSLSHSPLFQAMYAWENAPPTKPSFEGLGVSPLRIGAETAKFDLTLFMSETEEGLRGSLDYCTELFDPATIARMIGHLQTLLEGIVENPERRITQLPILTRAEEHQLLMEWNDTKRDYPTDKCIHELFEAQVERTPDAVAVVFEDRQLTYRELNRRASRLAYYLRKFGVGPEVLVGICMERSLEMVVGLLGILKAGGAYVPLDSEYPKDRLAFMLEDAQAPVLLTQRKLLGRLDEIQSPKSEIQNRIVVCIDREWEEIACESEADPVSGVMAENLAYVIYTSGSTGKPKGVAIPHQALLNLVFWHLRAFALTQSDQATQLASTAFDAAVWEIWPYLAAGATIHLAHREVFGSPTQLRDWLIAKGITISFIPTLLAEPLMLLDWLGPSHLRLLLTGGDKLNHFPPAGLPFELVNNYGPTENTVVTTSAHVCPGGQAHRAPAIGRPIANANVYILDHSLRPVPIGVAGELYVGGQSLARGYFNNPELTVEEFIPNPFGTEPGARLYRTGDLACYLPDGNIEFLGRIDHQVKIRGFRIELGEIEAALAEHPAIEVAVAAVKENNAGEKQLVAYVVGRSGMELVVSDVRKFLRMKLPEYMVPGFFVTLDELPLTPNGKVDRRVLPAPERGRPELKEAFVPPRTPIEEVISQIWSDILGVEQVGIYDNFFELGGNSLLAVRLFTEIEKAIGRRFPISALFQAPTVEELANIIGRDTGSSIWSSLVPIQANGSKPPLFCLHAGAGNVLFYRDLARNLDADQPVYALQALGLDGKQRPHTRIEDMAAHYIKEIRTIQPQGPYFLAGSSLGGLIAFEMAQQLHVQGQKVGVLAMFDSYGPGYPKYLPNISLFRHRLYGFVQRVDLHMGNILLLGPKEKLAYLLERARIAKGRVKRRGKNIADKISIVIGHPSQRALRKSENTIGQAARNYVAQVYPGRVTVFRASKQPLAIYPDPTLGWGELAIGGVEVHEVPGYHGAIEREPRVRILAKHLRACIQKATEQGNGRTSSTSPRKSSRTDRGELAVVARNEVDTYHIKSMER